MNSLLTFEAAARHRNVSRAAEGLNVTPAAVSRMVARLEAHLETALFVRHANGVSLTEPGEILFDAIAKGLTGIENALRRTGDRRARAETVMLSLSTGFTTHWLMPRMAMFKRAFPSVDLRFQLITGARGGPVNDVDLGMRFVNGADERHEAFFVMPEILLPVCAPGYLDAHGSEDAELDREPGITVALGDGHPNWSSLFAPAKAERLADSMIFSDDAIVVQAALLGRGVALGWLNVAAHRLRNGTLVPAGGRPTRTGRHCHLVRLRDKPKREIVDRVRDWIVAELEADVAAVDALYPAFALEPRSWTAP